MSELALVDVGHGSCAVLRGSRITIFDAGPGSSLLHYLLVEGIEHVDALYLSHADEDHIRGVIALLGSDTLTVSEVYLNPDSMKESELWKTLVYELDDHRRRAQIELHTSIVEGHICHDDGSVVARALAPRERLVLLGAGQTDQEGRQIQSNSMSVVVEVLVDDERRMLLMGDLDDVGLDHLIDAVPDLNAPVLVYPHHGGHCKHGASEEDNTVFARALMNAVNPDRVLFSIGRGQNLTPRSEIILTIREERPDAHIMCTQLSTRCSAEVSGGTLEHLVERFALGRERGRCCAGTIVLGIADEEPNPTRAAHHDFISSSVATPLCR